MRPRPKNRSTSKAAGRALGGRGEGEGDRVTRAMGTENQCTPGSQTSAHSARFYRFEDAQGRLHLVDSIDSVPQALRAHAACIEYRADATDFSRQITQAGPNAARIFGLGALAALLVLLVFWRVPATRRLAVRLAILAGVVALLGGAYFAWLRRNAGLSSDALATPSALIDDAKAAVAKMNARTQAEQNELKETERAK